MRFFILAHYFALMIILGGVSFCGAWFFFKTSQATDAMNTVVRVMAIATSTKVTFFFHLLMTGFPYLKTIIYIFKV